MPITIARRTLLSAAAMAAALSLAPVASAQDKITLRLSSPASETDQRAVALTTVFAPAVA